MAFYPWSRKAGVCPKSQIEGLCLYVLFSFLPLDSALGTAGASSLAAGTACPAQCILPYGPVSWPEFTTGWHLGEQILFLIFERSLNLYGILLSVLNEEKHLSTCRYLKWIKKRGLLWYVIVLVNDWQFLNLAPKLRAEIRSVSVVCGYLFPATATSPVNKKQNLTPHPYSNKLSHWSVRCDFFFF